MGLLSRCFVQPGSTSPVRSPGQRCSFVPLADSVASFVCLDAPLCHFLVVVQNLEHLQLVCAVVSQALQAPDRPSIPLDFLGLRGPGEPVVGLPNAERLADDQEDAQPPQLESQFRPTLDLLLVQDNEAVTSIANTFRASMLETQSYLLGRTPLIRRLLLNEFGEILLDHEGSELGSILPLSSQIVGTQSIPQILTSLNEGLAARCTRNT